MGKFEFLGEWPVEAKAAVAPSLADRLIKDDAPKFHATVREELRVRNESAVQDLAHAILARERSEAA